jgi:predicted MFS family arabinose efflux permease
MTTAPPASAPNAPAIPAIAVPLLSLAAFGSGMSMRATDPLLPLLSREFGVALGHASLVVTVFAIAYGLAQLLFGPLGDRFGKYFVVGAAACACALTAALCALAPGFELLLVARVLAGATAAAIMPLSMAWIGDVIPYDQRQPVLARFLIGQVLGLSAGVLVGGLAADAGQWRLPFIVVTLVFAAVGAGVLWLNARLPAHARQTRPVQGSALRHMLAEFSAIAGVPWARLVLITVFLEGGFLYGPFAFIATHLHHVHGVSLTRAGAMVMLFGFGGVGFALASGKLVRGLGETGLTRWGGLLLALSLLAIGLAPTWQWAIPACFLAGMGFYMLHNTLQINATQMAPERRGAAVSAFSCCFFLGQSAGVALCGLLVAHVGTAAILAGGALGVLAVALNFSQRLRARRK